MQQFKFGMHETEQILDIKEWKYSKWWCGQINEEAEKYKVNKVSEYLWIIAFG